MTGGNPNAAARPRPGAKAGGLTAIIGSVAAGVLYVTIPEDEGTRYQAYRDIVGVLTICNGDTNDVRPGLVETREGCQRRLEQQLVAHAAPVMACTPRLKEPGRDYQRAAAVSLAYNVGVGAYCRSSVDRHFDAGNWRQGCDALLAWNKAGGRPVRGLTLRRQRERAICLRGVTK
jgi:lysozyme